jgi:hypothetical protein
VSQLVCAAADADRLSRNATSKPTPRTWRDRQKLCVHRAILSRVSRWNQGAHSGWTKNLRARRGAGHAHAHCEAWENDVASPAPGLGNPRSRAAFSGRQNRRERTQAVFFHAVGRAAGVATGKLTLHAFDPSREAAAHMQRRTCHGKKGQGNPRLVHARLWARTRTYNRRWCHALPGHVEPPR